MSDLNVCVFEGNLTRNAELSYFQDQTPYCKFCIGNNKTWKNKNGEYESIPSFFDFVMKGNYAAAMAKYLTKGRGVKVVCRAKQQRWNSEGQKFSRIIFEVTDLSLNPVNNNNGSKNWQNDSQNNDYQTQEEEPEFIPFENGEDIPF